MPTPKLTAVLYSTDIVGDLLRIDTIGRISNCLIQFVSAAFEDGDSLVFIGDGIHEQDSSPQVALWKTDQNLNIGSHISYRISIVLPDTQKKMLRQLSGTGWWHLEIAPGRRILRADRGISLPESR
jgi:hypothetical protein